ncbi:hypothetical protein SerAS12_3797 [Serratia sp. AS12]|uniref:hypothetical protein n=1 Tax=Serratia TaxID=613 RepID=UPI00020E9FF3|nr:MULTISPECIES: hypothetical protein [Serratia]AEF46898.1 hypothetical protein SerAS9_3796 [Serratia plymuthica AS9]AEF51850.1 hypothetical protein SerAS12_3797 [Serratia sp. AS12]AEG29557.1 hypothetical protein SerAS13_3797 [Serratia sp. AS13]UTN95592.1 hypothetical protein NLX81_19305 [Serratia plymuthica]
MKAAMLSGVGQKKSHHQNVVIDINKHTEQQLGMNLREQRETCQDQAIGKAGVTCCVRSLVIFKLCIKSYTW